MTDEETEQELNETVEEGPVQEEPEQEPTEPVLPEPEEQDEPEQEEPAEQGEQEETEQGEPEQEEPAEPSPGFSKNAAVMSPNWRRYRVLLNVLLDDGITYSQTEIDSIIHTFLDRVV